MLLDAYYSQNDASIMCQGLVLVLNRFVTGILVLEISVRRTKIFAGKYGPPV